MSLKQKLNRLLSPYSSKWLKELDATDIQPETRNRLQLPGKDVHELLGDDRPKTLAVAQLPTPTHKKHRKYKQHHKPGKVTRATKKAEYSPQHNVKGGRIVRTMPKGLQKIKEGQERDA